MTDDRAAPRLCETFGDQLPITGASISVFGDASRQSTICATDATAARLDELQFELGEGPHWEAVKSGAPVLLPDVRRAPLTTFPAFGASLFELNVRALFTLPMVAGAVAVGVVALYRSRPGALSPSSLDRARQLTDQATTRSVQQALLGAVVEHPDQEP